MGLAQEVDLLNQVSARWDEAAGVVMADKPLRSVRGEMADDIRVEGAGALPPADPNEYPDAELDERPRFDPPDTGGESDDGRGVDPGWICIEREAS